MRLLTLTPLLAALAPLVCAQQDPASTIPTTLTLTRTVERVLATTTLTRGANATTPLPTAPATPTLSLTLTPYYNGTASAIGTGAASGSGSGALLTGTQSASLAQPTSGARRVGAQALGLGAALAFLGAVAL